jgi:hypothetical protein
MAGTHTEPATEAGRNVSAFFDSYRVAFDRLDSEDIAKHFIHPMQSTLDTGGAVLAAVAGPSVLRGNLERLLALYQAMDFGSARVLRLVASEISPCIVQATVDWELLDRAGARLYTFAATYTLVRVDGSLRISALAHNEISRYRRYLAHRLPAGTQPRTPWATN